MLKNNGNVSTPEETSSKSSIPKSVADENEDSDKLPIRDEEMNSPSMDLEGSDQHNDPGKMFIGGLSWQTTAEGLRDYFSKFGEVNECMVMRDPATKRARGFGFITFAHPNSVEKVLAEATHELDNKKIDPKVAFPKRAQQPKVTKTKKVFIGGLSSTSTLEDMKNYFQQYGKVCFFKYLTFDGNIKINKF
jgi:RNA-binding protein Musashi